MQLADAPRTELLPGQRLVAGLPFIFNLDLYNAAVADRQIEQGLPADLTSLSDDELRDAFYAYLNASARRRGEPAVETFGDRVCNERARRVAAYGEAA